MSKGEPLSMSAIGCILGLEPGVFQRGLNGLQKHGFVTSSRSGRKRLFLLNLDHALSRVVGGYAADSHLSPAETLVASRPAHVREPSLEYDSASQKILILAGPNGAGKSTFAARFLGAAAGCKQFVNADGIARGLSPFDPDAAALRAGRLMIEEVARHVSTRQNFAIETTLSGRRHQREIEMWQSCGYRVKIVFLSLPAVEIAIERVAIRVAQGGHNIPLDTIRRRFERGLDNFHKVYRPMVDAWALYDSSGLEPVLLDDGEEDR